MSPPKQPGKFEDLLLAEFQEAWSHYRHLETTRIQYLGFFFTVVFGVLGFVITVLKDSQPQNLSWVILGLFTLVWLLYMLTVLLFTSVKKLGFVLRHYENVMKQIRMIIYPKKQDIDAILNVRQIQHPIMKMKIFSIQNATEYILITSCIILTVIQVVGAIGFSQNDIIPKWQVWIMISYCVTMITMMFYVVILPIVQAKAQGRKR